MEHNKRDSVIHKWGYVQARDEAQAGRSQADATKADNLALVERLKYVQGYQAQPRTRKCGLSSATPACWSCTHICPQQLCMQLASTVHLHMLLIQLPCTLTLHSTEQHIPLLLCVILSTSASHHNISNGSESTVFSFKFRILDPNSIH